MAIPVLTSQSTYADFYVNFLLPNKFCLFSDELTVNWPARRLWTQPNGTVNIGALLEGFKGTTIILSFPNNATQRMEAFVLPTVVDLSSAPIQLSISHPVSISPTGSHVKDTRTSSCFT
uniref:JmjC domain-containing protein 4 n=1 Tax=Schistocephalus solidus TaxID=70667 RepID=A0A0X3PGX8_SCHSO